MFFKKDCEKTLSIVGGTTMAFVGVAGAVKAEVSTPTIILSAITAFYSGSQLGKSLGVILDSDLRSTYKCISCKHEVTV